MFIWNIPPTPSNFPPSFAGGPPAGSKYGTESEHGFGNQVKETFPFKRKTEVAYKMVPNIERLWHSMLMLFILRRTLLKIYFGGSQPGVRVPIGLHIIKRGYSDYYLCC